MNVLVIAAHPDDEILGCGGVMARHVADGDEVHVLIATRGIPELYPHEDIEQTRKESRAAQQILGVAGLRFLDFPAPQLDSVPQHQIADAIRQEVDRTRAKTLYIPHRGDIHTDHRIVFLASLVAARPLDACSVRSIFCYETLSETEWAPPFVEDVFIPTQFVDISKHLETKLSAMACYKSQLKTEPHPRSLESIERLARIRGATVSVAAAEAFAVVRNVVR